MHPIFWQSPAPLWARFGATPAEAARAPDQARPALLRFASDDFMDRIIALLDADPARLGEVLARPETWRTPPGADTPDLIERVPMPRIARAASRSRALLQSRTSLDAVSAAADVIENGLPRPQLPLKLYQPAHQRFYLVGASLVCGIAGLPDRTVVAGGAPQVGFVLRRLLPETPGSDVATAREFAFVKDGSGARWRRVADGADDAVLAPGEEQLPLFPLAFRDAIQHPRTMWTGLVPVTRREEYIAAPVDRVALSLTAGQLRSLAPLPATAPPNSVMARLTQFKLLVAEPWKTLIAAANAASVTQPASGSGGETDLEAKTRLFKQNLQWQMQSWLILLDFADYLAAQLPAVWNAVGGASGPLTAQQQTLFNWLSTAQQPPALVTSCINPDTGVQLKPSWSTVAEALKGIVAARRGLEQIDLLYAADNAVDARWPGFHFLLAGLAAQAGSSPAICTGPFQSLPGPNPAPAENVTPDPLIPGRTPQQLEAAQRVAMIDRLTAMVGRALDPRPETDQPALPFAMQLANTLKDANGDSGWFVIRYVYLNPECGPLDAPTLSAPSQRFQLANFFDPDAPARPIRITLPLDTSPAGLRRHNKSTAFVISDMLCGQIQRAKGMGLGDLVRSVLPWPLHKDLDTGANGACINANGINIGMICSLSIPIITICALILLIIIVTLLDLIFRWLPYFITCFPVPGLRAKPPGAS
jgi:hypothetical protein